MEWVRASRKSKTSRRVASCPSTSIKFPLSTEIALWHDDDVLVVPCPKLDATPRHDWSTPDKLEGSVHRLWLCRITDTRERQGRQTRRESLIASSTLVLVPCFRPAFSTDPTHAHTLASPSSQQSLVRLFPPTRLVRTRSASRCASKGSEKPRAEKLWVGKCEFMYDRQSVYLFTYSPSPQHIVLSVVFSSLCSLSLSLHSLYLWSKFPPWSAALCEKGANMLWIWCSFNTTW